MADIRLIPLDHVTYCILNYIELEKSYIRCVALHTVPMQYHYSPFLLVEFTFVHGMIAIVCPVLLRVPFLCGKQKCLNCIVNSNSGYMSIIQSTICLELRLRSEIGSEIIICDMIKRNESDVGDVVFEILVKTVFLCFILFLALSNPS